METIRTDGNKAQNFKQYFYNYLTDTNNSSLLQSIIALVNAMQPAGSPQRAEVRREIKERLASQAFLPDLFHDQLSDFTKFFDTLITELSQSRPLKVPGARKQLEQVAKPVRLSHNYQWSDTPYLGFHLLNNQVVFESHQTASATIKIDFPRLDIYFNDRKLQRVKDGEAYYSQQFKEAFFSEPVATLSAPARNLMSVLEADGDETETDPPQTSAVAASAPEPSAAAAAPARSNTADDEMIIAHFNAVIGNCGQDLIGMYMGLLCAYQANLDLLTKRWIKLTRIGRLYQIIVNTSMNWLCYLHNEATVSSAEDIKYWLAVNFNFEAILNQRDTITNDHKPVQFIVQQMIFRGSDARAFKTLIDQCSDTSLSMPCRDPDYEIALAIKHKLQHAFLCGLHKRTLLLRALTQNYEAFITQNSDGSRIYRAGSAIQDKIIGELVPAIPLNYFLDEELFPLERVELSQRHLDLIKDKCGRLAAEVIKSYFEHEDMKNNDSIAGAIAQGLGFKESIACLDKIHALVKLITDNTAKQQELLNKIPLGWIRGTMESPEASDAEAAGGVQSACEQFLSEVIDSLSNPDSDDPARADFLTRLTRICNEFPQLFTPVICKELAEILTSKRNKAKSNPESPAAKLLQIPEEAKRSWFRSAATDEMTFDKIIRALQSATVSLPAKPKDARITGLPDTRANVLAKTHSPA